jgi:hypothetical protein
VADEFEETPLSERAAYYRKMALDALLRADHSETERQREQYFNLARCWHQLAVQLEEKLEAAEIAIPGLPDAEHRVEK